MPYDQVLVQPVTSYYKGKAMRLAEASAERQGRLEEAQIDRLEAETDALKAPDMKAQRDAYKDFAEVGREMEARNLAQYEAEVGDLGEEGASAKANERFQRDRRVMQRLFPDFQSHEENPVWSRDAALGAIATADKVLDKLTGPGPDAPKTREVKRGEEVVTEEWDGGQWNEVGRGPRKEGVVVNVGGKAETKAEEKYGELTGQAYSDILTRGQMAAEKAGTLRAMVANPAITGPTQDFRAAGMSLFRDLGVPLAEGALNQVSNLGQYKAMAKQLVLTEQLKQKGPQTESDAKRIEETLGNTKNLQETNRLILNYQVAIADREVKLAEMAEDYREREGKIDGFQKELKEYVRSTPLAANNPKSGRLVFWNEFADAMKRSNPGMSDDEIMDVWRNKYGK